MAKTIAVVTMVSLRLGQVTRATSWRTCWINSVALVFAMPADLEGGVTLSYMAPRPASSQREAWEQLQRWQEWRGSNPQPPVLETGALPVELHSYSFQTTGTTSFEAHSLETPAARAPQDDLLA